MIGAYNHTQSSPSTTWTVSHQLGTLDVAADAILAYGGSPATVEKIMPLEIVVVDTNTVKILFSSAQTGYVRIVGEIN